MDALFLRILHGVDDSRELKKEDVDDLKVWVERLNIGRNAKKTLLDVLESRDDLDGIGWGRRGDAKKNFPVCRRASKNRYGAVS